MCDANAFREVLSAARVLPRPPAHSCKRSQTIHFWARTFAEHILFQTGDMPYECTACGNRFRYKISLRTHKCVGPHSPQTPSSSAIEESTATFNCPKAIDDFVNESYNRMGIIDSIDFRQLNMNESEKPPSCDQIEPIYPPNLIPAVDSVGLPPIGDLFDPSTLDEIHQLLNSPSENSWKHEAVNITTKISKHNVLSSFSRCKNTRAICRMDKSIRFVWSVHSGH